MTTETRQHAGSLAVTLAPVAVTDDRKNKAVKPPTPWPRMRIDDRRSFSELTIAQYHGISDIREEDRLAMYSKKAAIYIKETVGYHPEENSKELQLHHCEEFCEYHDLEITARYHDSPGIRHDFDWMMGEATQDNPPFDYIVVYKLRNFSWSLDETVLCRDRLRASGVSLISTTESSP